MMINKTTYSEEEITGWKLLTMLVWTNQYFKLSNEIMLFTKLNIGYQYDFKSNSPFLLPWLKMRIWTIGAKGGIIIIFLWFFQGKWTINYTGTQSFLNTFSNSLAWKHWVRLLNFDWLVQLAANKLFHQ